MYTYNIHTYIHTYIYTCMHKQAHGDMCRNTDTFQNFKIDVHVCLDVLAQVHVAVFTGTFRHQGRRMSAEFRLKILL
jgi:hypothetical protein